jgi:hypothetical protein
MLRGGVRLRMYRWHERGRRGWGRGVHVYVERDGVVRVARRPKQAGLRVLFDADKVSNKLSYYAHTRLDTELTPRTVLQLELPPGRNCPVDPRYAGFQFTVELAWRRKKRKRTKRS